MMTLSPPTIELRQATLEDAPALAALLLEMNDGQAESLVQHDIERMHGILAEMARYPDFRAYLLLRDGHLVGSFSLLVFGGPSHDGVPQALLDGVVIARAVRAMGLGQAMMEHAFNLARAAGCYKMSLSSSLKRQDAHRFYTQLGFDQHGISFSVTL